MSTLFDYKATVTISVGVVCSIGYSLDYLYEPYIIPFVTFTPGSMSSSVLRLDTIQNNVWEGTKWFKVSFVLLSDQNLKSGKPDTLTVYIRDDECE